MYITSGHGGYSGTHSRLPAETRKLDVLAGNGRGAKGSGGGHPGNLATFQSKTQTPTHRESRRIDEFEHVGRDYRTAAIWETSIFRASRQLFEIFMRLAANFRETRGSRMRDAVTVTDVPADGRGKFSSVSCYDTATALLPCRFTNLH